MDTQIILFGLWVAVMFTFLLGDVIRLFSGDQKPGEIMGKKATGSMWLAIAVLMVTPILAMVLTLILPQDLNRIMNISLASLWFLFNFFGIPSYPARFDQFLLLVSMFFNAITIYYAWTWV